MPTVTPSLTLPQPTLSAAFAAKPATVGTAAPAPATTPPAPPAAPTPSPSATVSFSPQAMAAASHPSTSTSPAAGAGATAAPAPLAVSHDGSVYESLKSGISTAVTDVGDAISDGAHAVVDGVETALSTANKVVKGTLELPFAAVSKACDAVGAVIDEL